MNQAGPPPSKRFQALLPPGSEPVPITVQWRGARPDGDRPARRAALRQALESALESHPGVRADWGTVSLSAQSVSGEVEVDQLDAVIERLEADGLGVALDVERQLTD